ncbi:HlyD family type I secretion periplasmic adaptor subunit [Zemynaea arenosa]|uniref:HlyD family type I secretion periplasmic adaptor subunit n=1 Tax=Zemynaea arenosa TaxID=2561931 RepID=UPI001E33D837|nr:HlyD family type I secretion periplasmic adaptor subunit [Massilia arenosa]
MNARVETEFLPDADEIELRPLPRFTRITLPLLLAALVAALLWATFSEVDEVVVASGRLINPLPNIVVQPLETAIVQSIDVRIGQVVHKGDRLATLDPTFAAADEQQLAARLKSLETQTTDLQAELQGGTAPSGAAAATDSDSLLQSRLSAERRANYRSQLAKINENIARLQASLQTNRHDQDVLATRLKSLREMETMQEKLVAQNYGARMQLLEARDRRLEVERDLIMTKNREEEIKRELASQQAEKAAFATSWRQKTMEDMLTITRQRDELHEQLSKAGKLHKLVSLTAPADGVVLDIAKLSPGSVARGTETFFTIVPIGAALEAEVQIDSLDVGYVRINQPVELKLDTFPFQRHGGLPGTVRTISGDAFKRDASTGGTLDAYYLARIALKSTQLKNMMPQSRLLPGMTLKAEIVVGHRTVMSYITWPLTKALNEAVREP